MPLRRFGRNGSHEVAFKYPQLVVLWTIGTTAAMSLCAAVLRRNSQCIQSRGLAGWCVERRKAHRGIFYRGRYRVYFSWPAGEFQRTVGRVARKPPCVTLGLRSQINIHELKQTYLWHTKKISCD